MNQGGWGMDATEFRRLEPMLTRYLQEFADCFSRKDTRAHLKTYVYGQLSNLDRKSVEPIADAAGVPVRTLQEYLSQHRWDEDLVRDRLQQRVARIHPREHSVGLIDETSFRKKGKKTPGVQRQYCGNIGKQDNCIVTVHLGYAGDDFHCLLDGELFLPESWSKDRERCRVAGIPEDMVYRPKTDIALELYDRARGNGLRFAWLTFDEWYGAKPKFLRGLQERTQDYVGEIPKSFRGWIDSPEVTSRPYRRGRGRGRKVPRLLADSAEARTAEELWEHDPRLRKKRWKPWRVKDGAKGPMLWEVKCTGFYPQDDRGLPGPRHQLIIARNVLDPSEVKYFLAYAPPRTRLPTLLLVAFSRWRVERCFQDGKGEIGLSHYEGRRYPGLKRHLILSAVSYLFLMEGKEALREKKSGMDGMPGPPGDQRLHPVLVA
jgi:SRSO17 transposase